MNKLYFEDEIVSLSTANGIGAIAIIKISGKNSFKLCEQIIGKKIANQKVNEIKFYKIFDDNRFIDEVLISKFKEPNSFTGENVIEINCHGGILVVDEIISLLKKRGARQANPGEFTQRAFLNGKIDLIKSAAIQEMVMSTNKTSLEIARNSLIMKTSDRLEKYKQQIIKIISELAVNIDYPEYTDNNVEKDAIMKLELGKITNSLQQYLLDCQNGSLISNGIKVAIVGKPNVGKSTLINLLSKTEVSIVTNIKGTTRDAIEKTINLDGLTLNLIDTAGIREAMDYVEKIGIEKSFQKIAESDLVLALFDAKSEWEITDQQIYDKIKNKKHITILNKAEKKAKNEILFDWETSLIEGPDLTPLVIKIKKKLNLEDFEKKNLEVLINMEQIRQLKEAIEILKYVIDNFELLEYDIVELELRTASNYLSRITGKDNNIDILTTMFTNFCLGK